MVHMKKKFDTKNGKKKLISLLFILLLMAFVGIYSLTSSTISIFKKWENGFNVNRNYTEQYFQDILSNEKM